jgi:hypothetical protein
MRASSDVVEFRASEVVATVRRDFTVIESFATSRKGAKWFPGLAKRLSKDKPAAAVHHLTSEAERTCYDWCKGAVDPPSRALIKLLHSDAGWTVLEYVMRGCKAPWWQEVIRAKRCAAAYEQAREQLELGIEVIS